jgi:hypothetical protein
MTTARRFLRRLLAGAWSGGAQGPGDAGVRDPEALKGPAAADRLEAAKQRLREEIPPPEEGDVDVGGPDGPRDAGQLEG